MSDWQRKLDFSSYTEKYDNGELSIQEFEKIVAEKLKALRDFDDYDIDLTKEDLIFEFEDIAADEEDGYGEQDFNYVLDRLYDWGDTSLDGKFGGKKVCWIQMR
jgi:hypothetical protein